MIKYLLVTVLLFCVFASAMAQVDKYDEAIYKESEVPEYELPDLLTTFDGEKVRSVEQWKQTRRPEIIKFFAENMYGKVPLPVDPIQKTFKVISKDKNCLEGLCTKKEVMVTFKNSRGSVDMPMVVFVPNTAEDPVPAIYWFSLTDIKNGGFELQNPQNFGMTRNGAPLKQLMLRGIALISLDAGTLGDINKSEADTLNGGIFELFFKAGQTNTRDDEWGLLGAWAYAMSGGMDYIIKDKNINSEQVAAMGVSVGGKATLWTAAQDPRIDMVLSVTSGHGGDALWRRQFGEILENMTTWLPRWLCRNAKKYAGDVDKMPVDQHMLLGAIAPRPIYVSSAMYDYWADPKGQWLGAYHASPIYKLYGKEVAFDSEEQPHPNTPIIKSQIGYHVRTGFHGLELYDWERYMEFIEYHFMKKPIRSVHEVYYQDGELLDHYPNKLEKSHILE